VSDPLPAFYINLATRPDRRTHMEAELARVGLVAERIEAKAPADLPPALLAAVTTRRHQRLTATELACSFSHRHVWRLMLDRGHAAALVLEDDAIISTALPAALADPLFLGPDVDAIQLETHPSNALIGPARRTTNPALARHRLLTSSLGTAGYLLTAHWAGRLLADPALDLYPVDKVLFGREAGSLYRAAVWQAVPALLIPVPESPGSSVGRSDLEIARAENRRQRPRRPRRAVRHQFHHWLVLAKSALTGRLWGARRIDIPAAPDLRSPR